jgi:anti-sigma-K factor RskA
MNIPADRTQTDRTGIKDDNAAFDRGMRQLHAAALAQVSPQTLAKLRAARHAAQAAPKPGHAWRWAAATAFSAVLAVALGVQFLPRSGTVPTAPPAVAAVNSDDEYGDSVAALDESPDLYMWLASSEAEPLAME